MPPEPRAPPPDRWGEAVDRDPAASRWDDARETPPPLQRDPVPVRRHIPRSVPTSTDCGYPRRRLRLTASAWSFLTVLPAASLKTWCLSPLRFPRGCRRHEPGQLL